MRSERTRSTLYFLVLPLIVYSAVIVFVTWPLTAQLSTHVAGPEYADSLEYLRLGWWGKYALQHGLNPFYQSLFGYPEGFFSATQWAQPLIYWPISLLGFVFNPAAAFNLWLLIEVILSGVTAYWLCRDVLREDSLRAIIAALIGGLIFMIFPTVQGHIFAGHINPLANYAFPVVLLCLLRIIEGRGSWRTALIGALTLLILALGNFTFPVYLILPTILFIGGYLLIFRRYLFILPVLRNLAVMFAVGGLFILPFYIPLARDITASNRLGYLQEGGWVEFSTDPMAFVSLSSTASWTAPLASEFSRNVLMPNLVEGSAYLGVGAVVLALIGVLRRRREAILWLVLALGCIVFSLGPLLKWNGQPVTYRLGDAVQSNIVLPYALFQSMPIISVTRTPGRFNITTGLALGVMAALGLHYVLLRFQRRERQLLLATLIGIFIIAEYQVSFPFHTSPVEVAEYYSKLVTQPDTLAVLEVPFADRNAQKRVLLEQTAHHKPLIAGYVSRATPVDPARLTFLSSVVYGTAYTPTLDSLPTDIVRGILREHGVGVVVYHWITVKNRDEVFVWAQKHFGKPVHNDQWMSIFEVPEPQQSVDTTSIAFSDDGWWISQNIRWMTDDNASIMVYSPIEQNRRFSLTLSPLLQSRRLQVVLDGEMIHARQVDSTPIDFWLHLTPGTHSLRFIQPEGCVPVPIQPTCLLQGRSDEATCKLHESEAGLCVSMSLNTVKVEQAEPEFKVDIVRLSDAETALQLKAAYVPATIETGKLFRVQTTWQAQGKLAGDYHLFVHVLDQSGQLVAQYDGIPGENTFPTAKWQASQQWMESIPLMLPSDLPIGQYSVYTGWYSYPDLKRLSVESDSPHAADGLVYLGDIEAK